MLGTGSGKVEDKKYVHVSTIMLSSAYKIVEDHAREHNCSFVDSLEDIIFKLNTLEKILNYNMYSEADIPQSIKAKLKINN